MKFGILIHKNTQNIGDDIQSFAAANLLPSVDYFINRETFDDFKTDNDEPVAVVMSAWYMWAKWNWPPSRHIVPLYIGMHWSDHQIAEQDGTPVKTEFLQGIGGEYLNKYGPIGCRDMSTLNSFKEIGINSYFSGCITLALPKMPIVKPEKEYVCIVDIGVDLIQHTKKLLEGTGIEVRVVKHYKDYRNSDATYEERTKAVTDLLTIYQNAKCIITRRLHCALPCLAMDVPVLLINSRKPSAVGRFEPYFDWIHNCKREAYLDGSCGFDIANPPANNGGHIKTRNQIIESVNNFVEKYKDSNGSYKDYDRLDYTDNEIIKWRHDTMKHVMNDWFMYTRNDFNAIKKLNNQVEKKQSSEKQLKKQTDDLKKRIKTLEKEKSSLIDKNEKILDENKEILKQNDRYEKVFNCRPVKATIKVRNAFMKDEKKIKL